jgi:Metallo-peptidase family M12B Reprolysin-like
VRERQTQASEPAAPAAAPRTPARGAAATVLALQRRAGNGAVNRLLARQTPGPLGAAYDAARAAKEAYVKAGKRGPITYDPSTRNTDNYYGGFDVSYDPSPGKQILTIGLRGVADFQPGMFLRKGRAVPNEPSAQTAEAARKINKLKDPAKRAVEVAKWQWSSGGGPDAGDENTFMTKFKESVETAWRGRHPFVCTREYWEDLDAFVDIDVNLVKMDATHKPGSPYHLRTLVYKVPADYIGGGADVHRTTSPAKSGGAFSNLMTVTAVDVDPRRDDLLISHVRFAHGSSTVPPKRVADLKALAKEMPNAPKDSTVGVADLTVSPQGASADERKARFDAIAKVLTGAGMQASRIKFLAGGEGDVTDLVIGGGAPQTVVAHESGHMFGLDDEYTGSGAYAAGKTTEHTKFAAKVGEKGVLHAKSDSIMSEGSVVRRQHYVTFLDALKVVSGIEEWDFGRAREVKPPSPYEDLPESRHKEVAYA